MDRSLGEAEPPVEVYIGGPLDEIDAAINRRGTRWQVWIRVGDEVFMHPQTFTHQEEAGAVAGPVALALGRHRYPPR